MPKIKVFFLSDGSDLKGIERVTDIKHIQFFRLLLTWNSSWPRRYIIGEDKETWRNQARKFYVLFLEWACLIPGFLYLKNRIGKLSFFELGHTYITIFMNMLAAARLIIIFFDSYQKLGGRFFNEFHLFHHKHKSEYAMKTHVLVHKMCHFMVYYLTFMITGGIMLFNATPLYNNFSSGAFKNRNNATFEQSVYYELPIDYTHNFRGFLIVHIFNWYISFVCTSCICLTDMYLSIIVFHIWGHLRILIYNLENFPHAGKHDNKDMSTPYFTEEEQKKTFNKLRDIILHHRFITRFTAQVNSVFGPSLFIYYAFHQVSGCLLLLECSQLDTKALVRYGPLTLIMFQQLLQISIIFELLGSMSDKLVDAAYMVPWERMDTGNRKILQIFLTHVQVPIDVKALGMVRVGVQTMSGILRTTFSYFLMLRTFAVDQAQD